MTDSNNHRTAWLMLIGWSAVIWIMNTRTSVPETSSDALNDIMWQGAHIIGHVMLGLVAARAAIGQWGSGQGLLVSLLIVVPHAALDELVQVLVPGRNMNMTDIACNVGGVVVGVLAYRYWQTHQAPNVRDTVTAGAARRQ